MQESQQNNGQPSYQQSVIISGTIFGIVVFLLSLMASYTTISSEPTGFMFSPVQLIGTLGCLVGSFGGMFAIWHYSNQHGVSLTLGRGALIGFLVGVAVIVVNVLLNEMWTWVDPDLTKQVMEHTLANIRAMDLPSQQEQQMMDMMANSMKEQSVIGEFLWGVPFYGILNLITAMIGVKMFGQNEI